MLKKLRGLILADRIFWSIVICISTFFIWLKFIDSLIGMKLFYIVAIVLVIFFIYLTRPKVNNKKIKF